jgi:hypothetical protein
MRCTYFLILLLLISGTSFGQIYQNMAQPGYKFSRARFDSVLTIPTGLGNLKNITGGKDTGQIRFNKSDSSIYVWNGNAWIKAGGSISDSLKLNVSDTAAMLAPYVRASALTIPTLTQVLESAVGSNEAGANQIKDLGVATDNFDAIPFIQAKDSINLRLRISDTASMLTPYARQQALVDTAAAIRAASGAGMAIGGAITGATAGSALFAGTGGVLAQDNANFFWDNTNKRLGIGTSTTGNPLTGLELRNYTAATSILNQNAPSIRILGNVWSTGSGGASNERGWTITNTTASGATPGSTQNILNFNSFLNGTTDATVLSISRGAGISVTGGGTFSGGGSFGTPVTIISGAFGTPNTGLSIQNSFSASVGNPNNQPPAIFQNGRFWNGSVSIVNGIAQSVVNQTSTTNYWKLNSVFNSVAAPDFFSAHSNGQLGIGTSATAPVASAIVDMGSTTQGVLIPRMTLAQRNAIATPAAGLQVIVTGETGGEFVSMYNSSTAAWERASSNWTLSGSNLYPTTANRVGVGTTSPLSKFSVVKDNIGNPTITTYGLDSTGFSIGNNTAAGSSVLLQQPPPLSMFWNSWNTSTAASIENKFRIIGVPISNTFGQGTLSIQSALGGGSYTQALGISMTGVVSVANLLTVGGGGISNSGNMTGVSYTGTGSFTSNLNNPTAANSSTMNPFSIAGGITNTTGTKVWNSFSTTSNINAQSGGGTVIFRGYYHNPVLTNTVNLTHNAIETVTGNIVLNTTSGSTVIGGSTPDASAKLDVQSTTQGVLFPRMTTAEKTAIVSPAAGLQVYDTTLNQMSYYNGSSWVDF